MHPRQQPALAAPQALLLRAADDLATKFVGVFGKETVDPHVIQALAEVGIDDPEGKSLTRVRAIRDDVDAHVRALMADLATPPV